MELATTEFLPLESSAASQVSSVSTGETDLISEYVNRVAALSDNAPANAPGDVVATVILRDRLAKVVTQWMYDSSRLDRMQVADSSLRNLAKNDAFYSHRKALAALRLTVPCAQDEWWLQLDELADKSAEEGAWIWTATAGLLTAAAAGVGAEILRRFLKNGFDPAGTAALVAQSSLIALTGASFTERGTKHLRSLFEFTSIGRRAYVLSHLLLGACVLLVVLGLKLSLPRVAEWYVSKGDRARATNELQDAADAYRRAIALQPDLFIAHHLLSVVYEELGDTDGAGAEMKTAGNLPTDMKSQLAAQNNFAAWLLEKNRPVEALRPLEKLMLKLDQDGRKLDSKDRDGLRYAVHKNLGWAYLQIDAPAPALDNLMEAIKVPGNENRSAPYCLLEMLYEKSASRLPRIDDDTLHDYRQRCIGFYTPNDPAARPEWVAKAQSTLREHQ